MKNAQGNRSRWLRRITLVAPCLVAFAACTRPDYTYADDVPVNNGATSSTFGGSFAAGTGSTIGGSFTTDPCTFDGAANGKPALGDQAVSNQLPLHSGLYAEVTDAEAAALRAGGSLLPTPLDPPVPTPLSSVLTQISSTATEQRKPLIQQLLMRFKATRSAWPNPWALRLIDHAGSEHMNAVSITFKPNAWIVKLIDDAPSIVDVNNAPVTLEQANAAPERIAAVYYKTDAFQPTGMTQCETAKREFAVGNEAMIESISLGTPEILKRLNSDIDALNALFKVARSCTAFSRGLQTFHSDTVCNAWRFFDATSEYSAYQWSLSNPAELYKPTAQNLSSLIQALTADLFEPAPFVGTPGEVVGGGGQGGAGGAGGASDQAGAGGIGQGGD